MSEKNVAILKSMKNPIICSETVIIYENVTKALRTSMLSPHLYPQSDLFFFFFFFFFF